MDNFHPTRCVNDCDLALASGDAGRKRQRQRTAGVWVRTHPPLLCLQNGSTASIYPGKQPRRVAGSGILAIAGAENQKKAWLAGYRSAAIWWLLIYGMYGECLESLRNEVIRAEVSWIAGKDLKKWLCSLSRPAPPAA